MLFRSEFRKHFTAFYIIFLCALFVLNLGMTAYQYREYFSPDQKQIKEAKNELLTLYHTDPQAYEELASDFNTRVEEYNTHIMNLMMQDDPRPIPPFENKLIDLESYGDNKLFAELGAAVDATANYQSTLRTLMRDTLSRIKENDNPDSYMYRYYIELGSVYTRFTELSLDSDGKAAFVNGWNEYFSLKTPVVFLAVASIGLFCGTFPADEKAGMTGILHVSKSGGRSVTRAKLCYLAVSGTLLTMIFTLSPLLIPVISCGLSDMSVPVQAVEELKLCPYMISIGGYLALRTAVQVLIFLCFDLAVAVIGQYSGFEIPSFVFAVLLVIIGGVTPDKYSVIELADGEILFSKYQGINMFGSCANYTWVMTGIFAGILLLFLVLSLIRRDGRAVVVRKESSRRKRKYSLSLFKTEMYKQLICSGGFYLLIAALILKVLVSGYVYRPVLSGLERRYQEFIQLVRGEVNEESLAFIEEEAAYIERALAEYEPAKTAYREGKITGEEYSKYQDRYNYANSYQNAMEKLCERRDLLLPLSEEYDGIEFLYEAGVDRMLTAGFDIIAVLAAVFFCSGLFAGEYECGFSKILRLTKHGRAAVFRKKMLTALLFGLAVYILFSAVDIFYMFFYYSVDYLSANIMSIPRFAELGIDMSILSYLTLYKIVSFVGWMVFVLLVSALSTLLAGQIYTVIVSAMVIFIPFMTGYYGIPVLEPLSLTYFMAPEYIADGIITYILCTVGCVLTLVFAWRKWNGRRSAR